MKNFPFLSLKTAIYYRSSLAYWINACISWIKIQCDCP